MIFDGKIAKAKYAADPEKKNQAALDEGESFWNGCSEAGQASLYQYTNRDINSLINNHLYNGEDVDDEILMIISYLDEALQKASLPDEMILHRGISTDTWSKIRANKAFSTPGSEIELEGFTSTSYDPSVALKYASERSQGADTAIIEILAPKGTKAAAIEMHSQAPGDKEILINRNTRFKVIEARVEGNVTHLLWVAL